MTASCFLNFFTSVSDIFIVNIPVVTWNSLPGNIVDFTSLTRLKCSIKLTDFSGRLTICVED